MSRKGEKSRIETKLKKKKEISMSFPATIKNLPGPKTKDDSNTFKIKTKGDSSHKNLSILYTLSYMSTYNELSQWVENSSNGHKFIACPASTSNEDRSSCLNHLQELLIRTIKGMNKRKDGRDLKLANAALYGDYYTIACILASAAWSYWQMYSCAIFKDGDIVFCLKNDEINIQKKEFQKAQLEYIGAFVGFEKAEKKGAFQEVLDFEETEVILENDDNLGDLE